MVRPIANLKEDTLMKYTDVQFLAAWMAVLQAGTLPKMKILILHWVTEDQYCHAACMKLILQSKSVHTDAGIVI